MALQIVVLPAHGYACSCYLAVDPAENQAVLIDAGVRADLVLKALEPFKAPLCGILLTHGHYDHIFGLPELIKTFDVPVYCHPWEADALLPGSSKSVADLFGKTFSGADALSLPKGCHFVLGKMSITFWHTPGHTNGGVCYQIGDALFTGDTLLPGCAGRCDLPTGNESQLWESLAFLKQQMNEMEEKDPRQVYYPGHGSPVAIHQELLTNPYLQRAGIPKTMTHSSSDAQHCDD